MPSEREAPDGLVVVDKPRGPTSHDVVARVRRLLGTRRVGHAGTLDPLASGVLVVLVGEATKLAAFLTLDDKRYDATVVLGTATTTLDAEGEVTERAVLPPWLDDPALARRELERCLESERARSLQLPPIYSAIKVGGRSAHRRARAGEQVELTARPVAVHELCCEGIDLGRGSASTGATAEVRLRLHVSKGYYVRALARDLGVGLGIPAHLGALRRTASGRFDLGRAATPDFTAADLRAAMLSLAAAAALAMPTATLTAAGVLRARRGQLLGPDDFVSPPGSPAPSAWLDDEGSLVAVGQIDDAGSGRVLRGVAARESAR